VSGVRKILEADSRKQMTEDKRQTVFCLSHLFADTRHLTPETIITMAVGTFVRRMTLEN